jgi:hypothetical protein
VPHPERHEERRRKIDRPRLKAGQSFRSPLELVNYRKPLAFVLAAIFEQVSASRNLLHGGLIDQSVHPRKTGSTFPEALAAAHFSSVAA